MVPRTTATAQNKKTVTGTIVDANGEPIIGANIVEKGTTNGTITDIDGNFTLEVSEKSILLVSFIGYAPQEVMVGSQQKINVKMKEDTEMLDEVVVVGYGTQKVRCNNSCRIGVF